MMEKRDGILLNSIFISRFIIDLRRKCFTWTSKNSRAYRSRFYRISGTILANCNSFVWGIGVSVSAMCVYGQSVCSVDAATNRRHQLCSCWEKKELSVWVIVVKKSQSFFLAPGSPSFQPYMDCTYRQKPSRKLLFLYLFILFCVYFISFFIMLLFFFLLFIPPPPYIYIYIVAPIIFVWK